jgi:hypothetical protein
LYIHLYKYTPVGSNGVALSPFITDKLIPRSWATNEKLAIQSEIKDTNGTSCLFIVSKPFSNLSKHNKSFIISKEVLDAVYASLMSLFLSVLFGCVLTP